MTLLSSVLSIRGEGVTKQPLEDSDGNILMWNGEIFGGMKVYSFLTIITHKVAANESDTAILSNALKESSSPIQVMKNVQGPWAFVYFEVK